MWYGTKRRRMRAFTLAEIMIAVVVFGLLAAGVGAFMLYTSKILFATEKQASVAMSKRTFIDRMIKDGMDAGSFKLFTDIVYQDPATDGMIGDFVILYFYNGSNKITRSVSYFRDTEAEGDDSPVYRYIETFSPAEDPNDPAAELIPTKDELRTAKGRVFAGKSEGLFTKDSGGGSELNLIDAGIFLNYNNKAVLVRGNLLPEEDAPNQDPEAYNGAISPR